MPAGELVDDHEADVVAVMFVLAARVSETDDEQVERRGALAPTEEGQGLLLWGVGVGAGFGVVSCHFMLGCTLRTPRRPALPRPPLPLR